MRLLYGEHELTIDDKNRMLVPATVRKALDPEVDGNGFYLVLDVHPVPFLYPEKYYENLLNGVPSGLLPDETRIDFLHMATGMIERVEWDSQGRILIPEKLMRRAEIAREVTVVGVKDHLELWNRADWEARREVVLARKAEIAEAMKVQWTTKPPPQRDASQSQSQSESRLPPKDPAAE